MAYTGRGSARFLNVYVALVLLGALLALAAHLPPWPGAHVDAWEFVALLGLAILLDLMVVPLAGGGGASTSYAIYFAGLLTIGAVPMAWAAAIAGLAADGLLRRRPLARSAFNAAHSVLSLLLAGLAYAWCGGRTGHLTPAHMPAVVVAAGVLWATETTWVAMAVTLERGGRAWKRLVASLRPMLALDGAFASVGLLLALLYQGSGILVQQQPEGQGLLLFLVAVVVIPSGLLFYAYRLQGSLRQTYERSLEMLSSLVEAKLQQSQPGHGKAVAELAAALAQALELPATQAAQVRYAGYLHDIGKVGVPGRLLHRQRDPFEGEPLQVRRHPDIGVQILAPIAFLAPAAEMVAAHHERWDGLGYPGRLKGAEIPLGARLLALADAYQGLTQGYGQAALSPSQAMARVHQSAGSRFDPALVDALERLLREQGHLTEGPSASLNYAGAPVP